MGLLPIHVLFTSNPPHSFSGSRNTRIRRDMCVCVCVQKKIYISHYRHIYHRKMDLKTRHTQSFVQSKWLSLSLSPTSSVHLSFGQPKNTTEPLEIFIYENYYSCRARDFLLVLCHKRFFFGRFVERYFEKGIVEIPDNCFRLAIMNQTPFELL